MKFLKTLSLKNIRKKPTRSAALMLLAALLSLSIFTGSVVISSLQSGLQSYQERLGADVVAVPYEARTKGTFDSILLQGIPGTFYMDWQYYEKICSLNGVEQAAPQFFLASASASCCSVAVQVIGFDPDKDFTVQPWLYERYAEGLGDLDIIVGARVSPPTNGIVRLFNTDCRVVGQMDMTGTGLDTAVYCNMNTIAKMIENAKTLGFHQFDGVDPSKAVSSVMIKVAEGYSPQDVSDNINIYVRKVEAAPSASMFSGIASGLSGVSRMIGILTVMIWILALAILIIAFTMISHERVKEFAILRVMGASSKMVSRLILTESALISLAGSACGLLVGALAVIPFSGLIRSRLNLPYLMPGAGKLVLIAVCSLVLAVLAGSLTAAVSARKISKNDAGLILREGA